MEYVQERVTTLHALTDHVPDAPTDRAAIVVPMTEREFGGLAVERVLSALERVDPARVVVPLRSSPAEAKRFERWLAEFDVETDILWCDGPRVDRLLAEYELDGERGKGRDVWLGLGQALSEPFVVVHDADTRSYSPAYVRRLLFPLAHGHRFSKGYYARIEENTLYGRLFRLFFRPLVNTLRDRHDAPVLEYLASFRYALAGEFAATSDAIAAFRPPRDWGLEVGILGDAFEHTGFSGSAQVDLGTYEHDHRSVRGPTGLADMSETVARATFRVAEEHGVSPAYGSLSDRYRDAAEQLVDAYGLDAAFNGLEYDSANELDQIETYADAIVDPETDSGRSSDDERLPAWSETALDPADVADAAHRDLEEVDAP